MDVAAAAGVSRGTVSRVLNGGHWVSPEAAAAVERAIKETGFQANQYARSLVTGRANSVAFLLTEPQHLLFEDPNFSILLRGAAQALAAKGMPLLLMVAGTRDEQQQVLRYVGAGHVDGVLLISTHAGNPVVDALVAQRVPTIACGVPLGHEGAVGYVAADDLGGGRLMTRHLRERGRRTIAMITGPLDTPGGRMRLDGYRAEPGRRLRRDAGGERRLHARERRRGDAGAARAPAGPRRRVRRLGPDGRGRDAGAARGGPLGAGRRGGGRVRRLRPGRDAGPAADDDAAALARISQEMVRLLLEVVDGETPAAITLPTSLVVRSSTDGLTGTRPGVRRGELAHRHGAGQRVARAG